MQAYGSYSPLLAKDFVAKEEGCRLEAYQCSANVWTLGYGHTKGVEPGDTATSSGAERMLEEDLEITVGEFAPYVKVPVTEGQFIALTSLAFNLGPINVRRKCPKLMEKLNAGDYEGAAAEFLDVTGGGPGLVARRQREHDLFLRG